MEGCGYTPKMIRLVTEIFGKKSSPKLKRCSIAANDSQLYLVADFEKKNFKFRQNENRKRKH